MITPTAGLTYEGTKDNSYNETGGSVNTLDVSGKDAIVNIGRSIKGKKYNKISSTLGLSVATNIKLSTLLLTPEIHGSLNRRIAGHNATSYSKLEGSADYTRSQSQPHKVIYGIGGSLNIKSNNSFSLGLGYDMKLASKSYIARQGYVKMRMNF